MKSIVFFNNKGRMGKTTFTYHMGYALEQKRERRFYLLMPIRNVICLPICVMKMLLIMSGERMEIVYIRRLSLLFLVQVTLNL